MFPEHLGDDLRQILFSAIKLIIGLVYPASMIGFPPAKEKRTLGIVDECSVHVQVHLAFIPMMRQAVPCMSMLRSGKWLYFVSEQAWPY